MNTELATKIISKMDFSAADYIKNKDAILTDAFNLYSTLTGDKSPQVQEELLLILNHSFDERKKLSIKGIDLPEHFKDGCLFKIFVNDEEVQGRLHLTPKEIAVEIIYPYKDHKAGSKIDILAPIIWTERPETGSEANEEGRGKAISLLVDLYYSELQ